MARRSTGKRHEALTTEPAGDLDVLHRTSAPEKFYTLDDSLFPPLAVENGYLKPFCHAVPSKDSKDEEIDRLKQQLKEQQDTVSSQHEEIVRLNADLAASREKIAALAQSGQQLNKKTPVPVGQTPTPEPSAEPKKRRTRKPR